MTLFNVTRSYNTINKNVKGVAHTELATALEAHDWYITHEIRGWEVSERRIHVHVRLRADREMLGGLTKWRDVEDVVCNTLGGQLGHASIENLKSIGIVVFSLIVEVRR